MNTKKQEFQHFIEELQAEIPDETCCVCGHHLSSHIDEGDGFRCHCLGQDYYQCECFLRKNRHTSIDGYDLKKRAVRYLREEFKTKRQMVGKKHE